MVAPLEPTATPVVIYPQIVRNSKHTGAQTKALAQAARQIPSAQLIALAQDVIWSRDDLAYLDPTKNHVYAYGSLKHVVGRVWFFVGSVSWLCAEAELLEEGRAEFSDDTVAEMAKAATPVEFCDTTPLINTLVVADFEKSDKHHTRVARNTPQNTKHDGLWQYPEI